MSIQCQLVYFIVLTVTLKFAYSQGCMKPLRSTIAKIGDLETGHFSLLPPTPSNRYNWYRVTFSENYTSSIDVALSIIYLNGYSDPTGADFLIKPVTSPTYFDAVFTINVQATYIKAHIHYLASSRDDLRCGSFAVSDNELFQNHSSTLKKIRATYSLSGTSWANIKTKIIPFAFISGIKSEDKFFTVKISQVETTLVNNILYTSISISNNTKPIEFLYISFFAYSVIGKISTKQFPDNYSFLINTVKGNITDPYGMNGMTAVKGPGLQAQLRANLASSSSKPTRLLEELFSGLSELEISIFKKTFEIQELDIVNNEFLEPILKSTLVSSQVQNMFNVNVCLTYDNCLENGGKMALLKNETQACVLCSPKKIFNSYSEQCECEDGLILSSDECLTPAQYCGVDAVFQSGSCFHLVEFKDLCFASNNEIYSNTSRSCICLEGFEKQTLESGKVHCIPICLGGSKFSEQTEKCECPDGYFLGEKQCIKCTFNQVWDPQKKNCTCKNGTSPAKNGNCLVCSVYGQVNFEKSMCECKDGYIGNGLICRQIQTSGITILSNFK